jgi:hypothetical protein
MGSSIPSNWQSGVYKRDKRNSHFLFPRQMVRWASNWSISFSLSCCSSPFSVT